MKRKKIIPIVLCIVVICIVVVCIKIVIPSVQQHQLYKKSIAPFTSINLSMGQKELMRLEPGLKVKEGYTNYLEVPKEYDGYAGTLGVSPKKFIEWDSVEIARNDIQIYYSYIDLLGYLQTRFGDSFSRNTMDPVMSYDRGDDITCVWDLGSTIVNCSLYQKEGKKGGVTIHFVVQEVAP